MARRFAAAFYRLVLGHPFAVLLAAALLIAAAMHQAQYFELDASADTLLIEGDQDLETFRDIRARYGSDSVLFVTYSPAQPLFSEPSLDTIDALREDLLALDGVASIISLLDVPLIEAEGLTFDALEDGVPTLREPHPLSREQAIVAMRGSELYADLLINDAGDTTMLVVQLADDPRLAELQDQRQKLRKQRAAGELDAAGRRELVELERAFERRADQAQARREAVIAEVRAVLADYRDPPRIHLGGIPMIAVDMIEFVQNDIETFGVAVGLFIVVLLAAAFRRPRWVIVPSVICAVVVVVMIGWLGFAGWPVTVVSSNFISLVLIITLSLIIHLIVRYRELHAQDPSASQHDLLRGTIDSKFQPSLFTSLTTGISFGSLMFADIRPVIDFGLMMTCSVVLGFLLVFALFPSLLAPLKPGTVQRPRRDLMGQGNLGLVHVVQRHGNATVILFVALFALSVAGAFRLTVENRFIDYFHDDTEIYQGMALIDRELGGTTPLDVVVEAPRSFIEDYQAELEFQRELGLEPEPSPVDGYWFNAQQLERVTGMQDWLQDLDATGKVLSIGNVWELAKHLNGGEPLEPYELGILYKRLPPELRERFLDRFMTDDGMEIRFDIRVIDSLPGLERNELLERIRAGLPRKFDLEPEQVTLSGTMVLYNNVLQSLFRSQAVTLAVVFGAIMLMFGALYRSPRMAIIGPLPTLVAATMVLGMMGWIGLPLDIMTMTIAAIVIGIGVHDTIHYVDRYRIEIANGAADRQAADISHGAVGRAMVYTTVIVTLGFSILTLSNFMPTVYFGLLTGLAMILALINNLALLPLLLERLRPFKPA